MASQSSGEKLKIIAIDSLIGAGKSTVADILTDKLTDVIVIPEPVKDFCSFTTVDGDNISPLGCFYKNNIEALPTQLHILHCLGNCLS